MKTFPLLSNRIDPIIDRSPEIITFVAVFSMFFITETAFVSVMIFFAAILLLWHLKKPRSIFPWILLFGLCLFHAFYEKDVLGVAVYQVLLLYWIGFLILNNAFAFDSVSLRDSRRRITAQFSVGIIMLQAGLWKLFNPEFVSGAVFEHILSLDGRTAVMLDALGIRDSSYQEKNRALSDEPHEIGYDMSQSVSFEVMEALMTMSMPIAIFTIILDLVIGTLYLLPAGTTKKMHRAISKTRDILFIVFFIATYSLVPVPVFALIMLAMATSASSQNTSSKVKLFVVIALVILLSFRVSLQILG